MSNHQSQEQIYATPNEKLDGKPDRLSRRQFNRKALLGAAILALTAGGIGYELGKNDGSVRTPNVASAPATTPDMLAKQKVSNVLDTLVEGLIPSSPLEKVADDTMKLYKTTQVPRNGGVDIFTYQALYGIKEEGTVALQTGKVKSLSASYTKSVKGLDGQPENLIQKNVQIELNVNGDGYTVKASGLDMNPVDYNTTDTIRQAYTPTRQDILLQTVRDTINSIANPSSEMEG